MEVALAPTPQIAPPPAAAARPHRLIFGTFFLGNDEFGIEMTELQEISPPAKKFQKMPLAPDYLCGLYNLRGRVIPIIDLRLLLKLPAAAPREEDIPCMVILSQGPACIGILFDAMGEILRLKPKDVFPLLTRNPSDESKPSPVKSILTQNNGERVIQILDLHLLLSIKNLPALERRTPERLADQNFVTQRMRDLRRQKLIGFTVGECRLAFEIKCVLAILDNRETKPSPRKSSLCDSVITFNKRMVPVVPMAKLLELETPSTPRRIIVCKVENGDHVGFEIDEVTGIIPYFPDKVLPIPILGEHRPTIIRGCFTDSEGYELLVLNEKGTLSTPEIVELAVGHRKIANEREAEEVKSLGPQVSLLTFRMGKLYGIKLLDVVEVLVAPKEILRTPSMPAAVIGVLNLRGEPISVLDPRRLLRLDPAAPGAAASILIFRHEGRKVGMRVDCIESILSVPAGPELELPDIFFREEQPKLMSSFERGLHVEQNGVKIVLLILSAEQIVKLLVEALNAN